MNWMKENWLVILLLTTLLGGTGYVLADQNDKITAQAERMNNIVKEKADADDVKVLLGIQQQLMDFTKDELKEVHRTIDDMHPRQPAASLPKPPVVNP